MNVLILQVSSFTIYYINILLFHVSSFTVYYINALVIKAEDCLYSKANACSKTCMNVLTLHVSSSTIYCMNALLFHVSSFTIYYMNALVIKASPLYILKQMAHVSICFRFLSQCLWKSFKLQNLYAVQTIVYANVSNIRGLFRTQSFTNSSFLMVFMPSFVYILVL